MDKEKLYELLDIEEPADFEYFENIAALLECEEEIDYDEMFSLIKEVDKEVLEMLIDNYFEEIADSIPEDASEFYVLLDQIRLALMGLSKKSALDDKEGESALLNLTEELNRFRQWYCLDGEVICTALGSRREQVHSLRDALVLARLEKIDGEKYAYDFQGCLDYELDEYIMSFGDVIAAAEREEAEDNIDIDTEEILD